MVGESKRGSTATKPAAPPADQPADPQFVDFDEYVDIKVEKARHQIKQTDLVSAGVTLGLFVCVFLLVFVVLDHWALAGGFSPTARWLGFSVLLLTSTAWFTWKIARPAWRRVHALYAARMLEHADPRLRSSLLNLIDLRGSGREIPPHLRAAIEKHAALELTHVDVDQAIDRRQLMRVSYALLAVVTICCLYVLLSPKDTFASVQRLIFPASATAAPTRTEIANVTPGDVTLDSRTLLTVEADVAGTLPDKVWLHYTTADREFTDQPVEMRRTEGGLARFRAVVTGPQGRGLSQDLTYYVQAGDARTLDYQVTVVPTPSAQVDSVAYQYQAYTRTEPRVQEGGHIEAVEGTEVTVRATANLPVKSARLLRVFTQEQTQGGWELPAHEIVDGKQLVFKWRLEFRDDGTYEPFYYIQCATEDGRTDPEPTRYTIKIVPDQRPVVELVHPKEEQTRPANATIPLKIRARDPDYQLRYLTLRVRQNGEIVHEALLLDREQQAFDGTHELALKSIRAGALQPGDKLHLWIDARDNFKTFGKRGPNNSRDPSEPGLVINIVAPVSAEEAHQQLAQDKQEQQEQVAQADARENARNPDEQPEQKPEEQPAEDQPPREGEQRPDQAPQAAGEGDEGRPGEPGAGGKPSNTQRGQPEKQPPRRGEGPDNSGLRGAGQEGTESKPGADQPPQQKSAGDTQDKQPADFQEALQDLVNKERKRPEQPERRDPTQQPGAEEEEPANQNGPREGDDPTGSGDQEGTEQRPAGNQRGSKPEKGPRTSRGQTQPDESPAESSTDPEEGSEGERPEQPRSKPGASKKGTGSKTPQPRGAQRPENQPNDAAGSDDEPGDETSDPTDSDNAGTEKPQPAGTPKSKPGAAEKPGEKEEKRPRPGAEEMTEGEDPQGDAEEQPAREPKAGKPGVEEQPSETKPERGGTKKPMPQKSPGGEPGTADEPSESGRPQGTKPAQKPTPGGTDEAPEPSEAGAPPKPMKSGKPKPGAGDEPGEPTDDGERPMPRPMPGDGTDPGDPGDGDMPQEGDDPGAKPAGTKPNSKPAGAKPEKSPAEGKTGDGESGDGSQPDASQPGEGTDPSDMPGDDPGAESEKPGRGSDPRQKPSKTKPGGAKTEGNQPAGDGPPEPAEPSADAEKRMADGSETGEGTPEKAAGNEPRAQKPDEVKRKPGTKPEPAKRGEPGAPKPGSEQAEGKPDGQPAKPGQGPRESKDPADANPAEASKTKKPGARPREKRPGNEPTADRPEPGEGRPGQKSQKADNGEQGGGTPQSEGASGSDQEGPGDDSSKPGQQAAGKPSGKPSGQKGQPGQKGASGQSQQSPTGDQPSGEPGDSESSEGAPAEGSANQNNPKSKIQNPKSPAGSGNGGPRTGDAGDGAAADTAPDAVRAEDARNAANLVLKRLKKQLDRGEIDQQWLDDHGWTPEMMEQFTGWLEEGLAKPPEATPEAQARNRQFEAILDGLNLGSNTAKRSGAGEKRESRAQEIGGQRQTVPAEYRELYEAYTKGLARQPDAKPKKP